MVVIKAELGTLATALCGWVWPGCALGHVPLRAAGLSPRGDGTGLA